MRIDPETGRWTFEPATPQPKESDLHDAYVRVFNTPDGETVLEDLRKKSLLPSVDYLKDHHSAYIVRTARADFFQEILDRLNTEKAAQRRKKRTEETKND